MLTGKVGEISRRLRSVPSILWLGMAIYVVVLSYASWVRFANLGAGSWDLGINVQALSTASSGRLVDNPDYMLFGGQLGSNYLGIHFSPVFFLLSPIARWIPPAPFLFVLQWTALALGAPLVFWIARHGGVSVWVSTAIAGAYLLYPPSIMSGAYDFHLFAFLPAISFLLYYALLQHWWWVAAGALFLGAITEEAALVLAAFICFQVVVDASPSVRSALWVPGWDRGRWIVVAFAGAAAVGFVLEVLTMRSIAPGRGSELFVTVGQSLGISNLTSSLGVKLGYWALMVGFLAFLPLLSPRSLVAALPPFGLSIVSSNLNFSMLEWQYSLLAVPGIFLALVGTVRLLGKLRIRTPMGSDLPARVQPKSRAGRFVGGGSRRRSGQAIGVVLLIVVGIELAFSPLLPFVNQLPHSRSFTSLLPPSNNSALEAMIRQIPSDAPIIASEYLFSHLAQDPNAYPIAVYHVNGVLGPLGHLPSGFVPRFVLVFSSDRVWAHGMYRGFPANYSLLTSVNLTPGSPLWGPPAPAMRTIELFMQVTSPSAPQDHPAVWGIWQPLGHE